MPWHDVQAAVTNKCAKDIASSFIEKWNFARRDSELVESYPSLPFMVDYRHRELVEQWTQRISQDPRFIVAPVCYSTSAQTLRSITQWSGGMRTEASIGDAYIKLIEEANHLIYIENQYFISSRIEDQQSDEKQPNNLVARALYDRICRAIVNQEKLRVVIVVPVSPEGRFVDDVVVRYTMFQQYKTICRHPNSLLQALQRAHPETDLSNYIGVFCLRTADRLGGTWVTEMVYVHSKLMIIDDVAAIIGSANINDRSMQGSRDSEIAVLFRDEEFQPSRMNGVEYQAGKFCHALRSQLWREHLGLAPTDPIVNDPVSDETFLGVWIKTAQRNAAIFERVFPNIPQDSTENLPSDSSSLPKCTSDMTTAEVEEAMKGVRGHLTTYPLKYLSKTGFNFTMLTWGASIVIQESVFH